MYMYMGPLMKLNRHLNFQTILGECGMQECPAGSTCTCNDEGSTCSFAGRDLYLIS